jgi:hypothetical protein
MNDEEAVGLRQTRLMALDATLEDVRRALVRGVRIPSEFSAEIRGLLTVVSDLNGRVHKSCQPTPGGGKMP